MRRREFAAAPLSLAAGPAPAICRARGADGAPLPLEDLRRFHVCDQKLRPFPLRPEIEPGEVRFAPPDRPFRIGLTMVVPGFGHVMVYADNRGRGYTRDSLPQPLAFGSEAARDRIACVRRLIEDCRRSGYDVPPGPRRRIEKAEAALGQAGGPGRELEALAEALWAGEELVVDRARQAIARRGPRPGFLFGSNAFGYPRLGRPYAERFQAVFNYATLPFYLGPIEPVQGRPNYGNVEKILDWLAGTEILAKGHPLVWFYPGTTPAWLHGKPFEEVRRLALEHVRRSVSRFRRQIHVWDVINEAHMQNVLGFTLEQQVEMTAAAARAAREADPTCFRIVNCCCTWSDYMAREPKLGQQSVYDYLVMVRQAGIEYEALGLQYYYAARDMVEIERSLETFREFGKPVHITELGLPSSSEPVNNPFGQSTRYPWHGSQWSEGAQADWIEQFYTLAFSKPWIEAVTWWDLSDPAFIPHGGLLRSDLSPKEGYTRLADLIRRWRSPAA